MSDEKDVDLTAENEAVEEQASAPSEDEAVEKQASAPPEDEVAETPANDSELDGEDFKVVNDNDVSEDEAEAAMMAMLEDMPEEPTRAGVDDINFPQTAVSNAEFQQLSQPSAKPEVRNIDLLMDVNLPISIELGRTKMSISDILALGPGSVVELSKLAGEPVDVLVNQKIVARGEVVVIDENFGVRVTQLMTPEERLKILGEEN